MHYLYLFLAISFELIATSSLQASEQFTKWKPTSLVVVCFSLALYCMTLALKVIPLGIAYAIWSGVGIMAISLIGLIVYKQKLDWPAIIGISFIVSGVLIIHLFSKSAAHA